MQSNFFSRVQQGILDLIARFVFRHWQAILSAGVIASLYILVHAIALALFARDVTNTTPALTVTSLALTVVFGVFSTFGFAASIAVFHALRGLIPHWSHAAPKLEDIIQRSNDSLFILTANPGFLQALAPDDFRLWAKLLEARLEEGEIHGRVVFAYLERPRLEKKIKTWANGDVDVQVRMLKQLCNDVIFKWAQNSDTSVRERIFFVPLATDELPYFIAVGDRNRSAMFCRANLSDSAIRSSLIKGFKTEDLAICSALSEVFKHSIELNGVFYRYTCESCKLEQRLFDDDLFGAEKISSENFGEIPLMPCTECGTLAEGKRVRIASLEAEERSALLKRLWN